MLFPLSKTFCASGFYQRGGVHSEDVPHRKWEVDNTGKAEKLAELHAMLTEKKPYKEHLQLIKRYSDEGTRKDRMQTQAHKNNIKEVNDKVDRESKERQAETARQIAQFKKNVADNQSALTKQLKTQRDEFNAWRKEMETKVQESPPMWGANSPKEHPDCERARNEARMALKMNTREYFKKNREIKEALENRPLQPTSPKHARGLPDMTEVLAEKKKAGIDALTASKRNYENFLETLYGEHDDRVRKNKQELTKRVLDGKALAKSRSDTFFATKQGDESMFKTQLQDIKDKVAASPKNFGGYKPLHKSDKRVMKEEIDKELSGSASMSMMGTGKLSQGDRTLSPRALGLASS